METNVRSRIVLCLLTGAVLVIAGCSEPVGRTKETKKEVVDTPTERTTTTETHEKNTKVDPPR